MTLRFQQTDEVDRQVNEKRKTARWMVPGSLAFMVAVYWLRGESPRSFWESLAGAIAFGWLWLIVEPVYQEFRIRTKEIDGKVSAIEEVVNASKEGHAELLERLTAIENKIEGVN